MAKLNFSLFYIGFLLCLIVCSNYVEGKTWCVAQSQAPNWKLQQVLDDLCGRLDCKEILPGGSCFAPNTLRNHASYAIDLNFRVNGICDISYATPAVSNPYKWDEKTYVMAAAGENPNEEVNNQDHDNQGWEEVKKKKSKASNTVNIQWHLLTPTFILLRGGLMQNL